MPVFVGVGQGAFVKKMTETGETLPDGRVVVADTVLSSGGGGGGGDASAANQVVTNTRLGDVTEAAPASDTASSGLNGRLQRIAQRLSSLIAIFPASLGAKTSALSLSITPSSDSGLATAANQTAMTAKLPGLATTAAVSNVTAAAADTTILAANAARKGAIIFNDSTATLLLLLATGTASATNFSRRLTSGQALTLEPGEYTGIVKGIWSAANGAARVTEFS